MRVNGSLVGAGLSNEVKVVCALFRQEQALRAEKFGDGKS